ncbi:amino acid adenylation domain-containing protein [Daejeonella rubra]|uniref:Amino acid adenylation domain-containing protein n=1 Tax=Daejeonella rubra TaxID=990371 RepID=A0A1G9XWD9_9SPHI|nr:type I polyketide synthase [Daejeonella rubra]SDN01108.1 amino acid adenylation domain-containing protein [Daejeonella rubra]
MLTPEEKEKVLFSFNNTTIEFPGAYNYCDLFNQQVLSSPGQIAVVFEDREITYSELDSASNQIANNLISRGLQKESLIGICLDRSIEMITGILGILKAGAAYMPIDPEYPAERINFMLEDSGLKLILTDQKTFDNSDFLRDEKSCEIIILDSGNTRIQNFPSTSPDILIKPEDLAYVIYTSGSTGRPKGVMNEHGGLVNRLKWAQSYFNLNKNDVVLQKTTFCFDVSVWELLWPVMVGAKLIFAKPGGQKDSAYLEQLIEKKQVTTIHFVPSMLEIFLLGIQEGSCTSLKRVLCSGEELIPRYVSTFGEKLGHVDLFNLYGPTEAAIDVSCWAVPKNTPKVSIGKPVANTSIYILDEKMEPCGLGAEGELYIGGIQVARGYLNRPELNVSRFLENPFAGGRLYRSGDRARWLEDGNIEYLGRSDEQVKIRGFRIEPGEIENVILEFGGIRQCLVHVKEDIAGDKKLIAYIIAYEGKYDVRKLENYLRARIPDYMVPAHFIDIPELPLNSSGKTDRKALPSPGIERPELNVLYKAAITETEKLLAKLWASILNLNKVGVNDNFFELGGNSLLALRFVAVLKQEHQLTLPVTRLYQDPFISKIAAFLSGKVSSGRTLKIKNKASGTDIAVIGMSGRFPGAGNIEELWEVLKAGRETTSFFSENELDSSIPTAVRNDPNYVKARGIIEQAEYFDSKFFGMNSRMAELMDPQQRVFLEIAWETLESTGYLAEKFDGIIGVFAGSGSNTYYLNNVHTRPDLIAQAGNFQVSTLNEKDYIAMRTAYELNLKGPAVSVYSACSTSLLAIVQAVESLRKGQCELALAGGSAITSPIRSGHIYEEGAILSKDGHCRPFDADASGTVFSDGAGIVLLKNRADAERDGDTIYAIIKGFGLNNDGAGKASFTAPNAEGQADTISMAIADAGIDASSLSYIETHGTATPVGDPIEIEGLRMAFGQQDKRQFCALGSIKSNMGHLTHAAGVAGFIKTVLSLHNKQLPPSLFYDRPNPDIDFGNSPFYVNSALKNWESETKRRAGVSSFGVGGTNVHVILEEAETQPIKSESLEKKQLICWSAVSENSLNDYGKKLAGYLEKYPETELADIAYTLQLTRQNFAQRRFIIASDTRDLLRKLKSEDKQATDTKILQESATEVAFLFPGQGSQYPKMGNELYIQEPVYKKAVDECAELLLPWLKEDIRDILFAKISEEEKIHRTRYTQPALFVTEYALAKLWMSWGIRPAALCGHSIGEFAAAHLAGIFSLEDALKLVSERARLVDELPGGSMLAIKAKTSVLESLLPGGLSLAAINSPDLCVVSGPYQEIETFSKAMLEKGLPNRIIQTSHAFHSAMMDGMKEKYQAVVESVNLNPPRIPIVSSVTGNWMSEAEATSTAYWVEQIRLPVRFADAISTLWEDKTRVLLETGPGNATALFARQQARGTTLTAIAGFENKGEYAEVLRSLGKLWQNGIIPDWPGLYEGKAKRIMLPNYAFDRKRCWIEPGQTSYENASGLMAEENLEAIDQSLTRKDILIRKIKRILENASGIEMNSVDTSLNFIEIGLDSLLLTQVAITLKKEFTLPITFRQLNENLNNMDLLADYLDAGLPTDVYAAKSASDRKHSISPLNKISALEGISPDEAKEISKPFGASPRIEKQSQELNPAQASFLAELIKRYNTKTQGSKSYTQKHRSYMADPRVVSGFRPLTKEIIYPIVVKKSKGSRVWDLDDNEYIDALNGFGSNMLGFQPDIILNAIKEQMDKGYEIGPQHELAGDVCKLICEFTNTDRSALCSTGSEAVLGTMRIARTVTGRSLIVAFSGSYHGVFDEVIIRGTKTFRSIPAAPGIMPEAVQNMLILDYGTDESLRIIQERGNEIAAVLVEPVQSRRPEFQPIEFLKKLRVITEKSESVLIFDEVITGFRMHPGGAQALFGIQPDISSYGKVIGGGLPIGAIAGKRRYMDALDGGSWEYGDQSVPEAGVTYFAGTFVRHPLALVAAKASLEYFKQRGPALQEELNNKAAVLTNSLNSICRNLNIPLTVVGFGSMWKIKFKDEIPYSELLFTLMREKGIHIWDGFPCFVTESHTTTELESIAEAFKNSVIELISSHFLHPEANKSANFEPQGAENIPPVPGARLGRDREGNPAWFIADPEQPGKYLQVKHKNL